MEECQPSYELLVKYLSESLSDQEMEALLAWKSLSPENEQLFSQVLDLKIEKQYQKVNKYAQVAAAYERVEAKIARRQVNRFLRYAVRVAAVIVLCLSAFAVGSRWDMIGASEYTTIRVIDGEDVTKVPLADGSVVYLRDSSELRIPTKFSKNYREVSVIGHAFFEVNPDKNHPFIVRENKLQIKVLGTTFDIVADSLQQHVEVTLVSGAVVLQNEKNESVFEMHPNEHVSYDADTDVFTIDEVETNLLTAYYFDQTIFDKKTLREIANKLSEMFDVNINIQSKNLADRRYRLVVDKNETLPEVLEHIKFLSPITYKIAGTEVYLME